MQTITTIGFDIAKSVFQVHGVDAVGQVIVRRQLKRRQVIAFFQKLRPCLVGIEACASSHYWSRELQMLGHRVRLMPPAYVKPYVKRQKNDAADAEVFQVGLVDHERMLRHDANTCSNGGSCRRSVQTHRSTSPSTYNAHTLTCPRHAIIRLSTPQSPTQLPTR